MPCYNALCPILRNEWILEPSPIAVLPTDTSRAAEYVQIALLRQAGMARRVDLAAEMTQFAIDGACGALRRRYPEASEIDIRVRFVEQHYGSALGAHVRLALTAQADAHDLIL